MYNYTLLNLYCEIFCSNSYDERRTSFLLYTFEIFILPSIMLLTKRSKSDQRYKSPHFMSNPIFPTENQLVHIHEKPRLLARNGKRLNYYILKKLSRLFNIESKRSIDFHIARSLGSTFTIELLSLIGQSEGTIWQPFFFAFSN